MWKKLLGLMLGLLVLSSFNLVSADKTQDPWEKWAAEHTYKVQVVEKVKYDNGQIVKTIVYISPDLKKRFGVKASIHSKGTTWMKGQLWRVLVLLKDQS